MIRWIINLFRRKRQNAATAIRSAYMTTIYATSLGVLEVIANRAVDAADQCDDVRVLREDLTGWLGVMNEQHEALVAARDNAAVDFHLASKRGAERVVKAIEERLSELEAQRA